MALGSASSVEAWRSSPFDAIADVRSLHGIPTDVGRACSHGDPQSLDFDDVCMDMWKDITVGVRGIRRLKSILSKSSNAEERESKEEDDNVDRSDLRGKPIIRFPTCKKEGTRAAFRGRRNYSACSGSQEDKGNDSNSVKSEGGRSLSVFAGG
eukprot:TRINITY_DN3427_c0_g1_i1.p1 TRINITY_DN3427_c0_g1~~TRINITY_DN3427_c0_g1_i1.p1  ORF type:complete len:153 (+),score=21.84 TRINITY_DN3427_c0_g1_i1:102-560(+)